MNLKKTLGIAALLLLGFVAMVDAQYYGGRSSGGSGNLVWIIIGVIIGAIVLFLVCRELICWYYKINKIVALMEEQNALLKKHLGINDIPVDKQKEREKENEIVINNGDNTGKIKLIVERGDNVICSAIPLEITIDKKKAFSIENASRVIDFVDNGSHSIYASLDYNTQSETINFNTDNSEIKFKLSILGVGKIKLEKLD